MSMITISKPTFYDEFECIAGACDFTCCQEWRIAVDSKTYDKWRKIKVPQGVERWGEHLCDYVDYNDEQGTIVFNDVHKCAMMNKKGLCRIVLEYGEGALSETCHIFPREKHEFYDENGDVCHVEYSLMPCCPAVVDFLNREANLEIITQQKDRNLTKKDINYAMLGDNRQEFRIRDIMMGMISNEEYKLEEAILACYYILLDINDKGQDDEGAVIDSLNLTRIGEIISGIRAMELDPEETAIECNEIYLDIIDNYRNENMYSWILDITGAWADGFGGKTDYRDEKFIIQYKEYEKLLRNLIVEEIYADCLIPDGKIEDMLIKLQWIAMEYVAIRHLILLDSINSSARLQYNNMRDYIVVVSRMMGYEDDDIYEYMSNSFENIVWSFGYMALIIGRI